MLTFLHRFAIARWRRFADRAALEAHQARHLERFRRRVLPHMAFYRDRARAPLADLPVMDKAAVEENFAGLTRLGIGFEEALRLGREGAERDGVTFGTSTGTSGRRGVYVVDAAERWAWAAVMLGRALPPGGLWRRHRVAVLLAANSRLYATAQDSGRIAFRFFDLRAGLEPHLRPLEAFAPTLLVAPAHVLGLLARRGVAIAPERVFSAAEVLDPAERQAIAAAWGEPVHQIYQATEGFLGITCGHGTLHLNEDYVLVERDWIDAGRRAFTPIITDFSRHTQAMVRYRMNDVLIAADAPCPCGSPLLAIARIEGRRDDLLHVGSGGILFPEHVRAVVLDAAPAATDFEVVQTAPGRLVLALAGTVPPVQAEAARAALARAAARAGGLAVPPEIALRPFAPPVDHARKRRRVRREMVPEVSS